MTPITVLHLRDTDEIGGPGKTILETQRVIDRDRFRLHVGVFKTRNETGDTPFMREAAAQGIGVHVIRGWNQFDPRLVTRIATLCRALRADIVHTHEVKSDVLGYLAARLHRIPLVTTLHGWIANSVKQRAYVALDKMVIRKFDRVIVVSRQIHAELVARGVSEDRLRLLHNSIVLERYRRQGRRGMLGEILGRPLSGPVIASIGRLSPEKGHADLLDALGLVAQRGYNVSAVLVGDGPERPRLQEKIRALGLEASVHLPGYLSHPERILEDVDLMVLPSHTEGLPNAALEALAMEVPVLATAVGGTPEVIADGETGRLVSPRSPEALAAGIVDFLSHPEAWKRMAQRGRESVEANFDFRVRTRKLEDIYSGLVIRA